jgi:hypothetical protein
VTKDIIIITILYGSMRFSNIKSRGVSSAPVTHGINVELKKETVMRRVNDADNSEIISKD